METWKSVRIGSPSKIYPKMQNAMRISPSDPKAHTDFSDA